MQPTVEDVARAAGVSRQTVSNVLNAPERVRPQTRARVEAAIAQLGYRPNRLAQGLRAASSRMIGYRIEPVHPHALGSIHDRFLHALADAGRAEDHHLLLYTADDAEGEIAGAVSLYKAGAIDALVLYGLHPGDPRPPALRAHGVPFAAFGRTGDDDGHPWVDVDNTAGTAAATRHLAERGHRRIAFAGWPDGSAVSDRRAEGWREACAGLGLPLGPHLRGEDSLATGAALGARLLEHPDRPTAVVAATDTLAAGLLRTVRARGAELAVVGFDDTPTAAALDLSSVRQPIEAAGRAMISALLNPPLAGPAPADPPLAGGPQAARLLAPELIVRGSSTGTP
ncbi:LacI family DNA-binding transcriptional regulator [Dactylosporangium matsuzakiense]|uniref:Alanine racemase n=1 Tax=Dactylosporangium matsuzakiense TaxID=53360 RepID=A0A9W6NSP2_9ACTN|nr:LacI family DNA-binding transcriptional regulator [Dactylosporangium matsuzakiense]UWZ47992.1 LacI family DNA-binding transcriptional regulator [Dactylosporangium matsuzakiense]GLL07678.1 alanine racemase [Dactylosporangium matsuzakiense]